METTIAIIPKNRVEEIRIRFEEFNSKTFVEADDGTKQSSSEE